ncbi:MAG: L,D-transpeptidase family protein, partial [Pikeienuella sp.]
LTLGAGQRSGEDTVSQKWYYLSLTAFVVTQFVALAVNAQVKLSDTVVEAGNQNIGENSITVPAALLDVPIESVEPLTSEKVALVETALTGGRSANSALHNRFQISQATDNAAHTVYDNAAHTVYAERGYRPLWLGDNLNAGKARRLLRALANASDHGLPVSRYGLSSLEELITAGAAGGPEEVAAAETALTRAFLVYASDLARGVIEPQDIMEESRIERDEIDPARLLRMAALVDDPAAPLALAAPQSALYQRQLELVNELNAIVAAGDWAAAFEPVRTVLIGHSGPSTASVRARLVALGDLAPGGPDSVFDEAMEAAVLRFQRRHGLNADGVVGKGTQASLNVSAAERLDQAVATLERLRWTNRDLGKRHIFVNLADYTVQVVDDGVTLFEERVVIGKTEDHQTPEFSDQMTYLVINPTWTVPRSIATKEILPELQENPAYLGDNNMDLLPYDNSEPPNPLMTDWHSYTENTFPFMVRQQPGEDNALGQVKFMFPNEFDIYLHDTPSRSLFSKQKRAFSHGCVRVRDPLRLAKVLLGPSDVEAEKRLAKPLETGEQTRMQLAEPIPVHLTYRTAWVDDSGEFQFRDDVYGRDKRIRAALRRLGVN